ncbi:MAG: DUF6261 family protein [Marinifilum sp.]|jgi:hypothetical protein|nr:DUF6261 family protein [Marinifilum sp.]
MSLLIKMIFRLLRIDELISYCGELVAYLVTADTEGLQLESAISDLEANYQKSVKVVHTSRGSEYTEELKLKDQRRDESFIAFRTYIEANLHRKDQVTVDAAKKISDIIRDNGWSLHRTNRSTQSSKMASLTHRLSEPECRVWINQLGGSDWYQDMVDDNQGYLDTQKEKTRVESAKEDYVAMEVYKKLQVCCEELFEAIEVLHRVTGNNKYVPIAEFINDCTQRYMTVAQARETKKNNNKEEQQTSEE